MIKHVFWREYVADPNSPDALKRLKWIGRTVFWFRVLSTLAFLAVAGWFVVLMIVSQPVSIVVYEKLLSPWLVTPSIIIAVGLALDKVMTGVVWVIRLGMRRFLRAGTILKLEPRVVAVYNMFYRQGIHQGATTLYAMQQRFNLGLANLVPELQTAFA